MSGIYIPGMEMPRFCGECRFCCDGWCYVIPEDERQPGDIDRTQRTNWCPLIPVHDHGRLLKVLKTERECVSRNCDRDCNKCDLALEQSEILSTYDALIAMLDPADKGGSMMYLWESDFQESVVFNPIEIRGKKGRKKMKKANVAIYIPNMGADNFEKICNEKGMQFVYFEVPEHGRLIDADALCKVKGISNVAIGYINRAPTIIPADKEGE